MVSPSARGRGHQQVFRPCYGDSVEDDFGAAEAVGCRFYVAVLLLYFCAEEFEAFDVEVDGALAYGAASGEGDAGAAAAGYQRAEDQRGGAHGLY